MSKLAEEQPGPEQIELRCSAVVFRGQAVLLVRRVVDGSDDWVLPGGTPRHGETMAACVRREVFEETGLTAEPSRVALVLEAIGPATSLRPGIAGYLRNAWADRLRTAPYLGNMWRPAGAAAARAARAQR